MTNSIYDYKALEITGNERSLRDYEGKVVLIVNTASKCFFRKQYKSLEKLYAKYKDQGLEILAFACNDFNNQEPRTGINLEIFCRVNQQVTFPLFKRIHVKGDFIDPLYSFLTNKELNGYVDNKPLWNFHKYLIDKKGNVVDFYYPFTSPLSPKVEDRIKELLLQ